MHPLLIATIAYLYTVLKSSARMNAFLPLLLFVILFQLFPVGLSEEVECLDQQEACECDDTYTSCEFELQIEELQTFTSYAKDQNENLLVRGTPGDVYFLDSTGYHPSVRPDSNSPERNGSCYLQGSIINETDFTKENCSIPMTVDGVSYRRYIAVNSRIPGPTLIITEDQLVKVRVVNSLTSEAITIHWHGMHQRNTPWMDGVGFISQYPIGPGETFDYIFKATPAGTHWYHSHVGAQRTDGLFGALIVRERNVPNPQQAIFDFPSRHTLTLLDWQREDSLGLFVKIHSTLGFFPSKSIGEVPTNRDSLYSPRTRSQDGVEVGPVPYWSGLINGRGRMNKSIRTPLSIFRVSQGGLYRFRVVGAQSLYAYRLSIDRHKLQMIATDGHFIKSKEVDSVVVHSGERYDFVINTTDQSGTAFWIRAQTLETQVMDYREHSARAILLYDDSNENLQWTDGYSAVTSSPNPCDENNQCYVLNCPFKNFSDPYTACIHLTELETLSPLPDEKLPKFTTTPDCSDCLQFFNFGFEGASDTSAVNGKNFQLPTVPYQTNCGQYDKDNETDSGVKTCLKCQPNDVTNSFDCKCINVQKIAGKETFKPDTEAKTIMMVFSAVGDVARRLNDFSHPIHLHGHSFHVLHIGHGEYDETGKLSGNSPDVNCGGGVFCRKPNWANGTMPEAVKQAAAGLNGRIRNTIIQKDTVIVPAGGYVVVAFQADNPGYWFLHCHIEVHQLEGMAVLIEEYNSGQHWKAPDKLTAEGSFIWEVYEYEEYLKRGTTCNAVSSIDSAEVKIIALSVTVGVLGFALCAMILCKICCCKKGKSYYERM